jgi:hypothetical protein
VKKTSLDALEEWLEIVGHIDITDEKHELIPTETTKNILLPAHPAESFRDIDQQAVARLVSEIVVHLLEAVEIEKE